MIRGFGALAHRNFRLFFYGQSLALVGTWIQTTAMSWLVYRLSGSAFLLGLTGFAAQIPMLVASPFTGVIADRFDRRRLLAAMQWLLLLHAATLALLAWHDLLEAWHITIAALLMGTAMAAETSARQSYVPALVEDRADLPSALALGAFLQNAGRMIGPTIAGFLIHAASEAGCFLANALSKLGVLGSLSAIDAPRPRRASTARSVRAELLEAFRYQRSLTPVRVLMKHIAVFSFVVTPYSVLLPIYAAEVFGGGAATLGLLMGAAGMGGVCGGAVLAWRNRVGGLVTLNQRATAACGVALLGFAWNTQFWAALALLFVVGAAVIVVVTSTSTVTQMVVDEDKRARVMSFYTMSFLGVMPLGALCAGTAAEAFGVQAVVCTGGAVCVLASIALLRRLPELRDHLRPLYDRLGL
ncbi:MAG: MFS transporter [Pseudomonadota bacterium]